MKDKRLEEQFKGYFDGVEIPELPNNIVADAKKSVKRRDTRLPRFAKIASIAASFVLVFAVAAVLIARADFSVVQPDSPNQGGAAGAPSASTYTASELRFDEENAYTLSKVDKSLTFIENLAYKSNAEVTGAYTSHFANEETAFAYAEVTLISGARYDAQIFVEYTEQTFEPLKDYANYSAGTYRGVSYRLNNDELADNGEPVNKLYIETNGVKYYFTVQSSDKNSYKKCIDLLLNN